MVPEAPLERTEPGLAAAGDGWFVLNAREARWAVADGLGAGLGFEGDTLFPQVGINIRVLGPGQPIAMYHWEADQEDFLVLSGEAVLVIEGEERALRAWDFVHCPAGTKHVLVGAGDGPCAVLAVGAREHTTTPSPDGTLEWIDDWGGYPVDEAAVRHHAGVEQETTEQDVAYADFPPSVRTAYRDGWLPG
jgi:quercetin dioxygenase-like cupin family protein